MVQFVLVHHDFKDIKWGDRSIMYSATTALHVKSKKSPLRKLKIDIYYYLGDVHFSTTRLLSIPLGTYHGGYQDIFVFPIVVAEYTSEDLEKYSRRNVTLHGKAVRIL